MKKYFLLLSMCLLSISLFSQTDNPVYDPDGNTIPGLPEQQHPLPVSPDGGNEWQSIGPFGGDVLDIAIDPIDDDRVYLAAGYPYMRESDEDSWTVIESLFAVSPSGIQCMEINEAGVVYAGGYYTYGKIFASTDQGASWQQKLLLSGNGVLSINIDPSNQDNMYVTTTTNISGSNNKVIIKSSDGGESWSPIDMVDHFPVGMACNALAIDPDDSDVLVALGDGGFSFTSKAIISTDGGETWQDITNGLPADRPFNAVTIFDGAIYISGGQLFGGNTMGIYKSTDDGSSWEDLSIGFPIKVVNDLTIHPEDANTLYAATEGDGVYHSTDGGETWEFSSGGAGDNGSCRKVVFNPNDFTQLYAGFLSLGVCSSTNGGADWTSISIGIATLKLNAIEVDPNDPEVILASFEAENSGGCYLYDPLAGDWGLVSGLPATRFSAVTIGIDGRMYAWSNGPTTVAAEGLYRSEDGGETWENTGPDLGSVFETQMFCVAVSQTDPDLIFIGGNNFGVNGWASMIYRTTDAGENWENVFQGPENDGFRYLYIDPNSDDQVVYAAYKSESPGAGFMKSIDGGSNWLPINAGVSPDTKWGSCIISDPNDSDILYGGAGGYGGTPGRVYKSEDAGISWLETDLSVSNNYSKVTDMVISPDDSNILYAATSIDGVYITENGFNWVDANDGLLASNITAFSNLFEDDAGVLSFYAASFGNSAFLQELSDGTTIGIPPDKLEHPKIELFPNPARNNLTVRIPDNSKPPASIEIYNMLGACVLSREIDASEREFSLNLTKLQQGVYQVMIRTKSTDLTKKLIIR